MLAIDNSGNFYAVNSGGTGYTFLYRFTRNEIVDGKIQDLTPVVNDANSRIGFYGTFGSLAWDHDKDVLYMIGSSSVLSSSASICITIDPQTGKGTRTNTTEANGQDVTRYGSRVQNTIYGLYIVPSKASIIRPSSDATGITLDRTEVNGLIGTEFKLNEKVAPWNLSDPTVAWTTSNEAVATVDQNGTVTLVGSGEAVITATTNAKPHLTERAPCGLQSWTPFPSPLWFTTKTNTPTGPISRPVTQLHGRPSARRPQSSSAAP
ncbi:MAG: Ig-like domain-containing protein [Oscillospiraceae bacterium]